MLRVRLPSTRNHLLRAAGLIVGVVVSGTLGYSLFGLDPIDAFYQTIITISTVGFRELVVVEPGNAWKIFTSVLILVGTGSMLYGATAVIESIVEGRITGQYRRYRMQRSIDDLSGHLIVCGMGRVGSSITDFVRSVGQEVVAIDRDASRLDGVDFLRDMDREALGALKISCEVLACASRESFGVVGEGEREDVQVALGSW